MATNNATPATGNQRMESPEPNPCTSCTSPSKSLPSELTVTTLPPTGSSPTIILSTQLSPLSELQSVDFMPADFLRVKLPSAKLAPVQQPPVEEPLEEDLDDMEEVDFFDAVEDAACGEPLWRRSGLDEEPSTAPSPDFAPPDAAAERLQALTNALEDCKKAVDLFFSNDIEGAAALLRPLRGQSLYHSLGTAIFEWIPAILTLEPAQVSAAAASLRSAISVCHRHRRPTTFVEALGNFMRKATSGRMNDVQAHAELCWAECMLLQAALTVLQSEDLAGLLRATMKVKAAFDTYRECGRILEQKVWEDDVSKEHFRSGVRLGIATFNVMISMLPPRIIAILEFVGFSGNKALGLAELEAGAKEGGLRSVLCELTLLLHHLVISHFAAAQPDLELCERLLERRLQVYPDGAWFLLLAGRLQLLRGRTADALATYARVASIPRLWPQLTHLTYWESMWAHCMSMQWREAAEYASLLRRGSMWSRTVYAYSRAAMLIQLGDDATTHERDEIAVLLREAAEYRQRIAGKSLPMEKFATKRATRWFAQAGHLHMPAVELACLWNMFPSLAEQRTAALRMLKIIEEDQARCPSIEEYQADNVALYRFLMGSIVLALDSPRLAIQHFEEVIRLRKDIKDDNFLVPYALVEMANCHLRLGEPRIARRLLINARRKYSGYALESRLHFRIHAKLEVIAEASREQEAD